MYTRFSHPFQYQGHRRFAHTNEFLLVFLRVLLDLRSIAKHGLCLIPFGVSLRASAFIDYGVTSFESQFPIRKEPTTIEQQVCCSNRFCGKLLI